MTPQKKLKPKPKPKPKPKKKARKKKPAADPRDSYHLPKRTEQEQTAHLSDDLQDAWRALRAALGGLGPSEVRTTHHAIVFARKTAFAFVRAKKKYLELSFFLPTTVDSELVHRVDSVSKTKWVHIVQLIHADQVERPLLDWLRDAYAYSG